MSGYDPFGKENSRFVLKGSACQVSRAFYLYLIRYIHDTVSDSQCRRQYDFIRQMLRIIQAVKKHFHCHFSHDFQMCGDTGQRWLGQDRQRCVIETDDRYIRRTANSDFTQVAESGDRRFLILGKESCRDMIFLFQPFADLSRTVFGRKAGINDQMLVVKTGIFHIINKILTSCLQGRAFFLV